METVEKRQEFKACIIDAETASAGGGALFVLFGQFYSDLLCLQLIESDFKRPACNYTAAAQVYR